MFGRKKRLKFIEENRVSPEEQVYLGLGAVLVDVNSASSLVFKMRGKPKYMAQIIEAGWGIVNRATSLQMIDWLLEQGHVAEYQTEFENFRAGGFKGTSAEKNADWKELEEDIKTFGSEFTVEDFRNCTTVVAWDFERAAFLARVCYHLGYLEEREAWEIIKERVAPLVRKEGFKDWKEYAVSFLAGRSFCFGANDVDVILTTNDLLGEKKEATVWQESPLSNL
ncbi:DUF1266 domain-containing protein [Listeria aquatica]|uniref:DUF1266 domain-containing protein n=1 Tax=Listeria aquatica TaxID=1494960 RepID=UPI003F713AD8